MDNIDDQAAAEKRGAVTPLQLVERQRRTYSQEQWTADGLTPYAQRRDQTFGQYVTNFYLIMLEPFVRNLVGKTAVTICDGRGVEGSYLQTQGLHTTATDLDAHHLLAMKQANWFEEWGRENAEALSFADDSFDWGMVKDGLHHLPRPMLGFYELLRVCREGLIMIEGQDAWLLRVARRWTGGTRDWECSGNYIYRFLRREVEKTCLSLNLPFMASGNQLLPWIRKYEEFKIGSVRYRGMRTLYSGVNLLFHSQGNTLFCIVFKRMPSDAEIGLLHKAGLRCTRLPRNPFISTA